MSLKSTLRFSEMNWARCRVLFVDPQAEPHCFKPRTGFAPRTLTSAEKGYSQLDKEVLAIVFAVKHFHQYLYAHYTL
jgi:hypothetical protein